MRRPDVVRFKSKSLLKTARAGWHRKLAFKCADERDAELLVGALRALTALPVDARRNLSRDLTRGATCVTAPRYGTLPAKPKARRGLNAVEPARPEVPDARAARPAAEPARAGELPGESRAASRLRGIIWDYPSIPLKAST